MKKCILINKESILINRASGILAGRKMLIRNLCWLKNDSSHTVNILKRNESRKKNKMRSAILHWLTKSTNLSLLWFVTLKTSLMMKSRSAEMSLSRFNQIDPVKSSISNICLKDKKRSHKDSRWYLNKILMGITISKMCLYRLANLKTNIRSS